MQELQFEASWDKALSTKDRKMIEELFQKTNSPEKETIRLTPIWEAVNYKDELLITVLIHNFNDSSLLFNETKLRYVLGDDQLAEHVFTLPNLIVPPAVSMPWTFIFPAASRNKEINYKNGKLLFA